MSQLPKVGQLIAPILGAVPQEQRPLLVALAEKIAAGRYRDWAKQASASDRLELFACADREEEIARRVEALYPDAEAVQAELGGGEYDAVARLLWFGPSEVPIVGKGTIVVVSAGTSDLPVAAEAAATARRFGNKVELLQDVGVAGVHRLLASVELLRSARVLIVVAGMEGALPSVVGGLVDKPVIAVPTSVGYGASLGGVAALLGMLTSCSSNVSVVNIDNGFGAANVATLINRL